VDSVLSDVGLDRQAKSLKIGHDARPRCDSWM
jgi:hypothetical protein